MSRLETVLTATEAAAGGDRLDGIADMDQNMIAAGDLLIREAASD